jgi:hypothetical protein
MGISTHKRGDLDLVTNVLQALRWHTTTTTQPGVKQSVLLQQSTSCAPASRTTIKRPIQSVKLGDFTVSRHTWRKNWVNCAVLTGNSAGLRTVFSSRLSHIEPRSSLTESHSFLSLPADTMMASSLQHPFLAIHSADENLMIYSFSNTTSYSTFYVFFSSFRITLWPMWLGNSKRQPCFYPP